MIYDRFQPLIPGIALPEGEFKADIMYSDGTMLSDQSIPRGAFFDDWNNANRNPIVAIRVHKPDYAEQLVNQLIKDKRWSADSRVRSIAKNTIQWLISTGRLTVNLEGTPEGKKPSNWLEDKMDELGITYAGNRKAVRNWYYDPAMYPEVHFDINNAILTKKPSGSGHAVVTPTGHTIAYTTAQKIWWAMNGRTDLLPYKPTVGEYVGRKIRYTSSHRVTINTMGIHVGCQTVPTKALADFAKQEGWSNTPPYSY